MGDHRAFLLLAIATVALLAIGIAAGQRLQERLGKAEGLLILLGVAIAAAFVARRLREATTPKNP